ncbi:MAG TPA: serine hydrolase domain-containing protein [Thermoanaerobaculia bacterium]|nr:serine hydrolase domain-containing protein [Thermoanaerobaculia bacterium]
MKRPDLVGRVLRSGLAASGLLYAVLSGAHLAAQSQAGHDHGAAHAGAAAHGKGPSSLPMAAPADVGMSEEGLAKLSAAMREMVDQGELAGVLTVVARHGKIVHFETVGQQDLDAGIPMSKDTIFRIYSMTKPIAGVALMTLYDEGKFQLDDPVGKYIPELANLKVAKEDGPDGNPVVEDAHHPMTIRELVSHSGGLTYGFFSRSQVDSLYQQANILDRDSTLKEFVGKLGKIPLRQQPGTQWHYSVSVDVQGYLVEVLSGQPFDQFLEERVFAPLGMKDTAFWVPEEKAARFSPLYVPDKDGKLVSQGRDEFSTPPKFFSGGGGMVSTAMDYLRFCQMLLNGGELDGVRILEPETVALMHTNQLPEAIPEINPMIGGPGNVFGIDFALVARPDGTADHPLAKGEYWWYGVGGTWFGINPVEDLIVVGMIQNRGGGAARKARLSSKRLVYEAILDPAAN